MKIRLTVVPLVILAAFCLHSAQTKDDRTVDFSYYHTSDQLELEVQNIQDRCGGLMTTEFVNDNPKMKLIKFNTGAQKQRKGFILFGEHARELISPETGLNMINQLCSFSSNQQEQSVLENYELQMILNANPMSRRQVESGDLCKRENEHNVDINRNYDSHWVQSEDHKQQTSSGESAFSEPESKTVKEAVSSFKPDIFITVHSGVLGMYTPWAYIDEQTDDNQENMMDVLEKANEKYCKVCQVGSGGKMAGYLAPGTSMDWAYEEMGVKYSFILEIFQGDSDRTDLRNILRDDYVIPKDEVSDDIEDNSFVEQSSSTENKFLGRDKKEQKKKTVHGCFADLEEPEDQIQKDLSSDLDAFASSSDELMSDYESCFIKFNPDNQQYYDLVVDNWSNALFNILDSTDQKLN